MHQVWPYLALSYNPTPFQPLASAANASGYAICLGFGEYASDYACAPQGQGAASCWKCPPKVGAPASFKPQGSQQPLPDNSTSLVGGGLPGSASLPTAGNRPPGLLLCTLLSGACLAVYACLSWAAG